MPSCIGIDDGPFPPKTGRTTHAPLVAAHLKGHRLHRVRVGWITVDGLDATQETEKLLQDLPRAPILLSGVTFGGFNLIDPRQVHRRFSLPTIVVVGSRPDNRAVKHALVKHFPDWEERWDIIRSLGPLKTVRPVADEPPLFFEALGCTPSQAKNILIHNAWVSRVPEPIRVASLLARGLFPPQGEPRLGAKRARLPVHLVAKNDLAVISQDSHRNKPITSPSRKQPAEKRGYDNKKLRHIREDSRFASCSSDRKAA